MAGRLEFEIADSNGGGSIEDMTGYFRSVARAVR